MRPNKVPTVDREFVFQRLTALHSSSAGIDAWIIVIEAFIELTVQIGDINHRVAPVAELGQVGIDGTSPEVKAGLSTTSAVTGQHVVLERPLELKGGSIRRRTLPESGPRTDDESVIAARHLVVVYIGKDG